MPGDDADAAGPTEEGDRTASERDDEHASGPAEDGTEATDGVSDASEAEAATDPTEELAADSSEDAPDAAEETDNATSEDEFTDAGGQVVAEPPAGRPEVSAGDEDGGEDVRDEEASDEDARGEDDVEGEEAEQAADTDQPSTPGDDVPPDVRKYDRFKKVDGAQYDRVNDFLRDRTYITAREWAIARLCADFRTETGVEMTKIGENLPHLVPFMTDTYTPQAVNQARSSFEQKVRKAGATFLYGAMSDFFTADELDDLMYEVTEVAKFLLEVEGVDLAVEAELDSEERISSVMREVRQASDELRYEGTTCPNCGHEIGADHGDHGAHAEEGDHGDHEAHADDGDPADHVEP